MAAIDWIILIGCGLVIFYCMLTMPRPMVLTREQWLQLPERHKSEIAPRHEDYERDD